jgi:hypothetical protein
VPETGTHHRLLTGAGGRPLTARLGACTFDSGTSFGLIVVTSVCPLDLVVIELAAIAFPAGRATLLETACADLLSATDAELVVARDCGR